LGGFEKREQTDEGRGGGNPSKRTLVDERKSLRERKKTGENGVSRGGAEGLALKEKKGRKEEKRGRSPSVQGKRVSSWTEKL